MTLTPKINRSTLREQVRERLRVAIIEGDFPPGTRLGEAELAEQFGVSRGTVREALRYLQQSGLATGADRSSVSVRLMGPDEISELFEVRGALEGLAAELVMASPRATQIIDQLEQHLPQVPAGTPYSERIAADMAFHEMLCTEAGNAVLLDSWRQLKDMMLVVFASGSGQAANTELMDRAYHQPLIDGLRTGDPDHARSVIRTHMGNASARWTPRVLEQTG